MTQSLHVIFGTGPAGIWTARALRETDCPVRAVNRSGKRPGLMPEDVEVVAADVSDARQAMDAARGAAVVYQALNPPYDKWPELFPPLQRAALEAGRITRVDARSIADGLNAPFAGDLALDTFAALDVEPVLVTEDEIAGAFRFLYERAKLACEPAGAAAVAAVLAGKVDLGDTGRTVCVVSGGNVAAGTAAGILACS